MDHDRTLDPLGLRQPKAESPVQEPAENRGAAYAVKTEPAQDDSLTSRDTSALMHGPSLVEPTPPVEQAHDVSTSQGGNEETLVEKDEEDVMMEDEEMVDLEGEAPSQPQTAAERTAARRKMKRFRYEQYAGGLGFDLTDDRLTHQQTRFLMSEFAKQPHPDASHRERLSREIPGLSPRQVQVWFQNR